LNWLLLQISHIMPTTPRVQKSRETESTDVEARVERNRPRSTHKLCFDAREGKKEEEEE